MEPVEWLMMLGARIGYRRLAKWAAGAVLALWFAVMFALPVLVGAAVSGNDDDAAAATPPCGDTPVPGPPPSGGGRSLNVTSDAEARKNATIIIARGIRSGVGERGVVVAIATAAQETGGTLHNLRYGDRDSLGLFQQRPSSGWGTTSQILNAVMSADAFYGVATHTKNPGLTDIPGWQSMPVTVAAQKVQRSGFPEAYAQWETSAQTVVKTLWAIAQRDSLSTGQPGTSISTLPLSSTTTDQAGACGPVDTAPGPTGPWTNPLGSAAYQTVSPFGMRFHPVLHQWVMHYGIDMAVPAGTPIRAVCGGVIVSAEYNDIGGNETAQKCGKDEVHYMHQSRFSARQGQTVKTGDVIGYVGTTGRSLGPHLHFEIRVNPTAEGQAGVKFATDPIAYMTKRGVKL